MLQVLSHTFRINFIILVFITEGATKEEIKQVFAKIALTTHPDQKSSTPETTKVSIH